MPTSMADEIFSHPAQRGGMNHRLSSNTVTDARLRAYQRKQTQSRDRLQTKEHRGDLVGQNVKEWRQWHQPGEQHLPLQWVRGSA